MKSHAADGFTRALVDAGVPLRVRRVTGAEVERFRAPAGKALVAVLELAITVPAEEVEGREDHLVSRLRALEAGGPEAARSVLEQLVR